MRYWVIIFMLVTICKSNLSFASGNNHEITFHLTRCDTDTATAKKQSLSVGLSYGSDATFFGRTSQLRFPYFTSDVIYNSKAGFFVYGSAWKVISSPPAIDEFDLGFGYSYKFSKRFKGSISYTKFLFDPQAQIIKSASSNDMNWNNSYDWKIFKTTLILDYLYGKSDDFFTTFSISRYLESNFSVFDSKDYLTFTPSVNIILGTQNFVERFSNDHGIFHGMDGGTPLSPNIPYIPNEYDRHITLINKEFNPLNYSIKIPVAYNRPHYTFEASYRYSIPVNVEGTLMNRRESFLNFTFYYVFY